MNDVINNLKYLQGYLHGLEAIGHEEDSAIGFALRHMSCIVGDTLDMVDDFEFCGEFQEELSPPRCTQCSQFLFKHPNDLLE